MFRKLVSIQALSGTTASTLALVIAGAICTPAIAQQTSASGTRQGTIGNGQDASTPDLPAPGHATSASKSTDIVVTGSRIRRDNFATPFELNVISKQESDLNGARDVASTLQAGSITSGTSQINGAFLGFVSENGAAANTVGLRGLGSERTLVLLNGRRLAPAGVGTQLVAADLNVLPDAIVDRIEILREGASSVYGSDAIAGVINIITDNKLDGITIEGFDNQPTDTGGAGNTMRGSIAAGKVFDRGHITASFEFKRETGLIAADRRGFTCPRDLLFNQTTGAEVGSIDPATGGLSCYPYALGSGSGIASGYGIAEGFTGLFNRITYANGDINTLRTANGLTRVSPSPVQNLQTIITPLKTYTGYLNGSYELDVLGDAEIYGEALFTRRESHQQNPQQLSLTQRLLSPNIQIYGGSYAGTPVSAYGYPTSPFFPNSAAAAGYNVFTPFILPQELQQNRQRIDYVRANGGLRGNLGIGDWKYDANFQYAHSSGTSTITQIATNRLNNVLQAVLAPTGTPASLIIAAIPGEFGAGNNYTCASNVDANDAIIAGSTCAPLDLYNPAVLQHGSIPANVYNYLYQPETEHTTFTEEIASIAFDGKLFNLPAGAVGAAVGYEHRYDATNDIPSLNTQDGNLYNYAAGIVKGSDQIDEVYGELDIPIFRDQPWAKAADIDVSGRYTHYRSYGSDFTYHINGQYTINDVIRIRGNYGTSFRAPNIYERLVTQTGFLGSGADPCSGFGESAGPGSPLYNNCVAALTPILGAAGALNYISSNGPEQRTVGGQGHLKSERSTTWGGGVIITAPANTIDVSLALDYFNIKVNGEIGNFGSDILTRCYDADNFGPSNPYCALIAPREVGGAHPGSIISFDSPFYNIAMQKSSGVDVDLQYGTHIAGGRFTARVQGTRNLHQEFQPFAGEPVTDFNGTLGQQGEPGGPKVVGNLDADWTDSSKTITIHYGLKYVGRQDSTSQYGGYIAGDGLGAVNTIYYVSPYFEHAVSVKLRFPDLGDFTVGVTNLTNSHPPIVSQTPGSDQEVIRIGNYDNSSNYDYYGRSVFMHFSHTFK